MHKKFYFVQMIGLIVSFSEDAASHSDKGAAVLDGDGIIVWHAHGDFLETRLVGEVFLLDFQEEVTQRLELPCRFFTVVGEGSHSHYSGQGDVLQFLLFALLKHFPTFVETEAEFRFFLCDVYL